MNTMQQYANAKALAPDALLLFRLGDFYELFLDDARTACNLLGLRLTTRDYDGDPVAMAGFPYHQLDGYLAKLIAAGYRAAVCEQITAPPAKPKPALMNSVPPANTDVSPGAPGFDTRRQPTLF